MKRRTFLKLGTGTVLGQALAACSGGHESGSNAGSDPPVGAPPDGRWEGNVVTGWTGQALQAIRAARPGPPMGARSLAVLYACIYNAWCAYDPVALPTRAGQAPRRPSPESTDANKAMAISYAAYAALADQFPLQKASFDAYMKTLGYDAASAAIDTGQPSGLGTAAAQAEIAYCHADGANQLGDLTPSGVPYADYTGYAPQNPPLIVGAPTPLSLIPAPGRWQPLTYTDAGGVVRTPVFLGAHWQRVKPFSLSSGSQLRPGPPAAPGTSEYVEQARRIVEVQAALSQEQKAIAEFWADGPGTELPPGHWVRFGLYVSERDRHTLNDDVKMFFALAQALEDAAIAAWDAKRAYDSERPITAVRFALQGQPITGYGTLGTAGGLRSILGQEWTPYQALSFPTPPFPDHVSGHSTFSAAAAEVLKRFTGSDRFGAGAKVLAGSMAIEAGMPASDVALGWPSFSAAAEQAGFSRVLGGIHFDNANLAGLALGRRIGQLVIDKAEALWSGKG